MFYNIFTKNPRVKRAFTIMEVMVVVVIIGAIAAFALPNYSLTISRSLQNEAINQLSLIHSANQIRFARTGQFYPLVANGTVNLAQINANLNLNVIANGLTYTCQVVGADGTTFQCDAVRAGAFGFTIRVNENPLGAGNPACAGACP